MINFMNLASSRYSFSLSPPPPPPPSPSPFIHTLL
jgi:hypothetical protein